MSIPDVTAITALLRTLPRPPADGPNIEYWATRLRLQALKMPQAWCVEPIALGPPDPDRSKLRPQLEAVADGINTLAAALGELSPEGWEALDLDEMEQHRLGHLGGEELHVTETLHAIRYRLDRMIVTIKRVEKRNPRCGSGRGVPGLRIFSQALAETFEGITGKRPTRIVVAGTDREGKTKGPFFDFVAAACALFEFPASAETVTRRAVEYLNQRRPVMDGSSKKTGQPSIRRG